MGADWNQVTLAGNIGSVEKKHVNEGERIVYKFSVAWNPRRKDRSGDWLPAHWFNCDLFSTDRGEKYNDTVIQKGNNIILTGEMQMSRWKPRDSEHFVNVFNINVSNIRLIAAGQGGQRSSRDEDWDDEDEPPRRATKKKSDLPFDDDEDDDRKATSRSKRSSKNDDDEEWD